MGALVLATILLIMVIVLAAYTSRRLTLPVSRALLGLQIVTLAWTIAIMSNIALPSADLKYPWAMLQMALAPAKIVSVWLFIVLFTGQANRFTLSAFGVMVVLLVGFGVGALTNEAHGWFSPLRWSTFDTIEPLGFGEWLAIPWGPLLWGAPAFAGALGIAALFQLLWGFQQSPNLVRRGGVPLLTGLLIAIAGSTIITLNLLPNPEADVPTVNLAIVLVATPLFAVALFRGRLFELKPMARSVVFTGLQDGIVVLDEAGVVQDVNPAAVRYLQADERSVLGALGDQVLRERLGTPVADLRAMTPREVTAVIDGGPRDLDIVVSPFHNEWGDDIGHLVTIRDITDRKTVERLKNEFVSVVSHELRTPLTSIRGSLGLLRGGIAGPLSDQGKQLADIAYQNTDRLSRLINDILDIEKIESGRLHFALRPHDLRDCLARAITANEGYANQFGVQLAVIIEPVEPCWVSVDDDRLGQVLANLLSNAIKFSPAGGVVTMTLSATATSARVAVRDHGPGIPPEFQQRIFQRFAQADSSSTRAKGGTGLGLSITKAIVERMGGRIDYHSAPGHGATFFFELPRIAAPVAEPSTTPPSVVR